MAVHLTIEWGDGYVSVGPVVPDALMRVLKYWHRTLEKEEGRSTLVATGEYRELFTISGGITPDQRFEQYMLTMPGFMSRIKALLRAEGYTFTIVDKRTPAPAPDYAKAFEGLRDYQCACAYTALASGGGVIACPTGWGKCLGPNTLCMWADGSIHKISDVKVGDLLMGDDNAPRRVIERIDGTGPMYRITPLTGQSFDVADHHILCLVKSGDCKRDKYPDGHIVEITVADYLKQSKTFKHRHKLYRVPIARKQATVRKQIKDLMRTGFKLERIFDGPYVGVRLDGNMHHLLADGTVVHNTHIIASIIKAYSHEQMCARNTPVIVVATPGRDITRKDFEDLKVLLPGRDVGLVMGGTKHFSNDVQVITLESLHLIEKEDIGIIIVDEVHTAASSKRTEIIIDARKALRWGVSATPDGRYDGRDLVTEGLFGPIVYQRTYAEGVADGALVPIKVFWIKAPLPERTRTHCSSETLGLEKYMLMKTHNGKYRKGVDRNDARNKLIAELLHRIPASLQTLCIMRHLDHMDKLMFHCSDIPTMHAATNQTELAENNYHNLAPISSKERQIAYDAMSTGKIRKIVTTYVYKQGVNFPQLNVVIVAGGGGSDIVAKQIPGRESRNIDGKPQAYLIDFWHDWDTALNKRNHVCSGPIHKDDRDREKAYTELGFEQVWLDSIEQLPFLEKPDGSAG